MRRGICFGPKGHPASVRTPGGLARPILDGPTHEPADLGEVFPRHVLQPDYLQRLRVGEGGASATNPRAVARPDNILDEAMYPAGILVPVAAAEAVSDRRRVRCVAVADCGGDGGCGNAA